MRLTPWLGYGSTGPYAKSAGYDVVIEAEAGMMHITGEKDGTPVKVRAQMMYSNSSGNDWNHRSAWL